MMASTLPVCASVRAALWISTAPGTRTIRMSSSLAPLRCRQSMALVSRRSVMNWLKRETTMPKRRPCALILPSMALCFGLAGCSIFTLLFYHGGAEAQRNQIPFTRMNADDADPSEAKRCENPNHSVTPCVRGESFPFEVGCALFEERGRSLFFVFGGAGDGKQRRF